MIKQFLSLYKPTYPAALIYMLQTTEYQIKPYLKWYWRTSDFSHVMVRRKLNYTKAAKLLLLSAYTWVFIEVLAGVILIYLGHWHKLVGGSPLGIALILGYPAVVAHLLVIPRWLGQEIIVKPRELRQISEAENKFKQFKGIKIAVAGSYGKTSMKEILLTVLSAGKKVAATPANKNVPISHARFINNLSGKEDILIIEYGEGRPGDVHNFAKNTHPTHGIITGIAPAHLDHYLNMDEVGRDIFSLATYLKGENVYVNEESPLVKPYLNSSYHLYNRSGALGWEVANVKKSITGTSFSLVKGKREIKLHTALLGDHNIGPLTLAAALADQFGLSSDQVIQGVNETKPFEHRMNPYQVNGAWVIDDTYNGNIEGIRAGTKLLSELPAKRKWYVTPGLVDQGSESRTVHYEMGELIAKAKPDIVVLMKNSVTDLISSGLKRGDFKGELRVESNPLDFYSNLGEFFVEGDLVMMQNDWPDNYY